MSDREEMEDEIEDIPRLIWDRPHYKWQQEIFVPRIYDGEADDIPDGFNAVRIDLDGTVGSDLNWKEAQKKAQIALEKGYWIFWNIELGLFSHLTLSLGNQAQYLTLGLSLDHFRNTLWKEFHGRTIGLGLYRGSLDFSEGFPWDPDSLIQLQGWLQNHFGEFSEFQKQTAIPVSDYSQVEPPLLKYHPSGRTLLRMFCRDVATDYLKLLLGHLPDALQPFLLLEAGNIHEPWECALLLDRERFLGFQLALMDCVVPYEGLSWEHEPAYAGYISQHPLKLQEPSDPKVGICLPSPFYSAQLSKHEPLAKITEELIEKKIPFRLIPEELLTSDWDGLDEIYVLSSVISPQVRRKLNGFVAAGGIVREGK